MLKYHSLVTYDLPLKDLSFSYLYVQSHFINIVHTLSLRFIKFSLALKPSSMQEISDFVVEVRDYPSYSFEKTRKFQKKVIRNTPAPSRTYLNLWANWLLRSRIIQYDNLKKKWVIWPLNSTLQIKNIEYTYILFHSKIEMLC